MTEATRAGSAPAQSVLHVGRMCGVSDGFAENSGITVVWSVSARANCSRLAYKAPLRSAPKRLAPSKLVPKTTAFRRRQSRNVACCRFAARKFASEKKTPRAGGGVAREE